MIYLDNGATTKVNQNILNKILPYLKDQYANPSSSYGFAFKTKNVIDEARKDISNILHCKENEIYFTSCGSESDNWALKGICFNKMFNGIKPHIITSKIEHHAILNTCKFLEKLGVEVTYVSVDKNGFASIDEIKNNIKDNTVLISIMYANNEIGTINNINQISKIAKKHNVLFHTDAVQAVGQVDINVKKQGIDMLSLSGHKFNAMKGIGVLYIRNGIKIEQLINGGKQENGMRGGTENICGIVSLAEALKLSYIDFDNRINNIIRLRNKLIDELLSIKDTELNGDRYNRLPNNVSINFKGVESESLLMLLDLNGIVVSAGSACTSGSLKPSHVLEAIGVDGKNTIRFTLGHDTTEEEIDIVINKVKELVNTIREMR